MPTPERDETFEVLDDHLVRKVVPARGKPYEHRCSLKMYKEVAHAAEEFGDAGFTLEEPAAKTKAPWTQISTALAFLKERGCAQTRRRRSYATSTFMFEDAMIEYHALAESG